MDRVSVRSVDVRTRTAADVRAVDATDFFEHELPEAFEARAALAVPGARELAPRRLRIEVDARSWTLSFDGNRFTVTSGDGAADAAVRLDADTIGDIVNDLVTPMTLFTAGELDMPAGRLDDFLDWWVVLRSVLDGRPVHTRGAVDFTDRAGSPLDLGRVFEPDDDPGELAHFLAEAGYLHVAGVFDRSEMAAVSADMDATASTYARDDGRSWWAHTSDGTDRLVRMQWFHEASPRIAALLADERLRRWSRLTGDGHRLGKPGANSNLAEALIKPIGVVDGISDVPWHKDCSLGSHSYRCCSMTVGISVTGADSESGQLRVVAGSHRALIQPAFVRRGLDLPFVDVPTNVGDITIHLSCTLHMSQPPVARERRVVYTDFSLFDRADDDPGEARMRRVREQAYKTVSQEPSPVGLKRS
jgi:Phytanoyl-CoA dioxygenase (PhyH)/SCP-2 sterol transfer family